MHKMGFGMGVIERKSVSVPKSLRKSVSVPKSLRKSVKKEVKEGK